MRPPRDLEPGELRIALDAPLRPAGRIARPCPMCEWPVRADDHSRSGLCGTCWNEYRQARGAWRVVESIRAYVDRYDDVPSAYFFNPQLAESRGGDAALRELERRAASGAVPDNATLRHHFGSHNAAIAAAGFTPRPNGRKRADL